MSKRIEKHTLQNYGWQYSICFEVNASVMWTKIYKPTYRITSSFVNRHSVFDI